jgi:hypothetical protein
VEIAQWENAGELEAGGACILCLKWFEIL